MVKKIVATTLAEYLAGHTAPVWMAKGQRGSCAAPYQVPNQARAAWAKANATDPQWTASQWERAQQTAKLT
jgi:hypothetical protein